MNREQAVLESIRQEMETLPGHLGVYYHNLSTGYQFGVRESEAFLAASVIKLPVFLYLLKTADMKETLTVEESDKVPGCGALSLFTGPVQTDIRSLCRLMIDLSDNTATNRLIRFCTIPALNEYFRSLGLAQTCLRRFLFDAEASAAGLENTISPKEMGLLLEKLYRGTLFPAETTSEALDILLDQQIGHKLDGKLNGIVPIAHKTGEDENLSNDVGLVLAPQPFVLCFAGHDTDVYRWEDLMRRSAFDLYHAQL